MDLYSISNDTISYMNLLGKTLDIYLRKMLILWFSVEILLTSYKNTPLSTFYLQTFHVLRSFQFISIHGIILYPFSSLIQRSTVRICSIFNFTKWVELVFVSGCKISYFINSYAGNTMLIVSSLHFYI